MKICSKCNELKDSDQFSKKKACKDGLNQICRECNGKRNKTWRINNIDKIKAESQTEEYKERKRRNQARFRNSEYGKQAQINWVKNNIERARAICRDRQHRERSSGSVSYEEWTSLLDQYGNKCVRCGRSEVEITRDHIIPLS